MPVCICLILEDRGEERPCYISFHWIYVERVLHPSLCTTITWCESTSHTLSQVSLLTGSRESSPGLIELTSPEASGILLPPVRTTHRNPPMRSPSQVWLVYHMRDGGIPPLSH